MVANALMLALAYLVLVVPFLWVLRPVRLVNPFSNAGRPLTFPTPLTESCR